MKDRRTFLKTGLLVASGLAISAPVLAKGKKNPIFHGIIYSEKDQGKWEGKAGSHVPKVRLKGSELTIVTNHIMSKIHYIVRHTLVSAKGEVLGAKTFYPSDKKAISTYELPNGFSGKLYATSFCNKHDFWINDFEV